MVPCVPSSRDSARLNSSHALPQYIYGMWMGGSHVIRVCASMCWVDESIPAWYAGYLTLLTGQPSS